MARLLGLVSSITFKFKIFKLKLKPYISIWKGKSFLIKFEIFLNYNYKRMNKVFLKQQQELFQKFLEWIKYNSY